MIARALSVDEVAEVVRSAGPGARVLPVAGASKPGLSSSGRDDVVALDLSDLSGIVEYDPAELTITALAGTPVEVVTQALAEHGQYLPFDPPLAGAGATLGGVLASGASGAGAFRHGGVRDFVIAVQFIDGTGRLIKGGAKVVKNAAGFDLPKLMVGSIGRLGVIVQLSFKVFPRPGATGTLELDAGDEIGRALAAASALVRSPVELQALDITPGFRVLARVGGRPETLEARLARLASAVELEPIVHQGEAEEALWRDAAELSWMRDGSLVRIGLSVHRLPALDTALAAVPGVQVRYTLGGAAAWISWPSAVSLEDLDELLCAHQVPGIVLIGGPDRARLGPATGGEFGRRVAQALDPGGRFLEI